MALEGTLEDFSLADIFQLIGIQRKSGVLTLKSAQETVTVTFHNGMVIGADSSPKKLEDRIGKVLVKTGLISGDQLKEALEKQQRTMQKIGFILVDQDYVSRDELKEALQIQVAQMIYRLFRWNRGEYYFDQKARVDPDSDESVPPISAESILMEGIQMIDEWPVIQKRIPNFDLIFRSIVPPEVIDSNDSDAVRSSDASMKGGGLLTQSKTEAADKVRLSKEEQEIFLLVDGKNTVSDIIESSKLGEFHTCKALYDLLERKIIAPVQILRRAAPGPESALEIVPEKQPPPKWIYFALGAAVLGVSILNISDPMRLATQKFFQKGDSVNLRASVNASRFNLVDSAVIMYFYVKGTLPRDLSELVAEKYLKNGDIVDAWSRPYDYSVQAVDTYSLSGHTSDGRPDSKLSSQRTLSRPEEPPAQKPSRSGGGIRFQHPR